MQKKQKYQTRISFAMISSFLILFYGLIFYEITTSLSKNLFLVGLILLLLGFISQKSNRKAGKYKFLKKTGILIVTPLAAIITFILSTQFGFGPVIASSSVALIYSSIASKIGRSLDNLSKSIYCGSFVGMGSSFVFTSTWMIGLAGILAGVMIVISHYVYRGIGGMLGTKAFISSTIIKAILIVLGG